MRACVPAREMHTYCVVNHGDFILKPRRVATSMRFRCQRVPLKLLATEHVVGETIYLQMVEEDVVLGSSGMGQMPLANRRSLTGRPPAQLTDVGPLSLVILLADPRGKWADELSGHGLDINDSIQRLCMATHGRVDPIILRSTLHQGAHPIGILVVEGWRIPSGQRVHPHTWHIANACRTYWKRREGMKFIEHKVIASAAVAAYASTENAPPTFHVDASPVALGTVAIRYLVSAEALMEPTRGPLVGSGLLEGMCNSSRLAPRDLKVCAAA